MRLVPLGIPLVLLLAGLAGCTDDAASPPAPDGRATPGAPEDDPADPDTVIEQATAAGASVEVIAISEDLSMLPSACAANPVNGCLGGHSQAQLQVQRDGIDRWIVNLTVTWTPGTDLTRTLEGRAMAYYECGFGCVAGGDKTLSSTSASPLQVQGILDEPVDESKGFWLTIDTPPNLPGGSIANGPQDVHIEGTLTAIVDPEAA